MGAAWRPGPGPAPTPTTASPSLCDGAVVAVKVVGVVVVVVVVVAVFVVVGGGGWWASSLEPPTHTSNVTVITVDGERRYAFVSSTRNTTCACTTAVSVEAAAATPALCTPDNEDEERGRRHSMRHPCITTNPMSDARTRAATAWVCSSSASASHEQELLLEIRTATVQLTANDSGCHRNGCTRTHSDSGEPSEFPAGDGKEREDGFPAPSAPSAPSRDPSGCPNNLSAEWLVSTARVRRNSAASAMRTRREKDSAKGAARAEGVDSVVRTLCGAPEAE